MSNHDSTLEKNKMEVGKQRVVETRTVGFARADFAEVETVFIVAKTYGAARLFAGITNLGLIYKGTVKYVSKAKQIKSINNRFNTVVIKLTAAEDNLANLGILRLCENKNLKILNYPIVGCPSYITT